MTESSDGVVRSSVEHVVVDVRVGDVGFVRVQRRDISPGDRKSTLGRRADEFRLDSTQQPFAEEFVGQRRGGEFFELGELVVPISGGGEKFGLGRGREEVGELSSEGISMMDGSGDEPRGGGDGVRNGERGVEIGERSGAAGVEEGGEGFREAGTEGREELEEGMVRSSLDAGRCG